ncbi:DUF6765 family protein [Photobacterium lipolyticum]|uniref:Uncharacterized protein n=1 Tax=Photobacterium lipolyticum TaxID=266810 RepID=A0A2T3MUQ8_9GAMM|nr:DUF6765 family protein [Photobacterium lipolyticum]PSW03700.1 hypothetical protein C9I89_16325 [Photobacterium lipolyticum]
MTYDFHYYGTYCAARLAGMEHPSALKLAYACQGVAEFQPDSHWLSPLKAGDYQFTPVSTALPKTLTGTLTTPPNPDGNSSDVNDPDHVDIPNAPWLAFYYLPAELPQHFAGGHLSQPFDQADERGNNGRGYYHPLKDVDWQNRCLRRQCNKSSTTGNVRDQHTNQRQKKRPVLQCQQNSELARHMINDSIGKQQQHGLLSIPLLGVRLFSYQNTWFYHNRLPQRLNTLQQELAYHTTDVLDAFIWTRYVIQCYLANQRISEKPDNPYHYFSQIEQVAQVLQQGTIAPQREYAWQREITQLVELTDEERVQLTYQPQRLLGEALLQGRHYKNLQSNPQTCGVIDNPTRFKQSDYYALCKACEFQTEWLNYGLKYSNFADQIRCESNVGDKSMWTGIN